MRAFVISILLFIGFGQLALAEGQASNPGPPPIVVLQGTQYENYQRNALSEKLNLSKYDPIYLLYGDPSSKLLFSFKYLLLQDVQIYFGYSQMIFWDLRQESRPMHDVNYSPDFFYRTVISGEILDAIEFVPWSHISNGRDATESRGYSSSSIKFHLKTTAFEDTIKASVRISNLFAIEENNQDFQNYVSPLEVRATATQFFPGVFDRGELSLRFFPGGRFAGDWQKGGQEIGLSFRLGGLRIVPSFYLQYYRGYGESLLDYSVNQSILRFGFVL